MLNNLFFGLLLAYIFLSVYLMWRYWFAPNDTERLKWLTRLVLLSLLPQFLNILADFLVPLLTQ